MLIFGVLALILVDYMQLEIPELYEMVINGIDKGYVVIDEVKYAFDMTFLLDRICLPMILIIVCMVFGRFLWRICMFGTAIKVETDLRERMFDHCKDLSQQYYQVNKVGNLMSLFTNDLDTVQECFGWGVMMLFDSLLLGGLALFKMWRMDWLLTLLSLIPMVFLLAVSLLVGRYMTKKWDERQEAYSQLSDFSQESFSGIAVIKAFVKEGLEAMAFKKLNKHNEKTNVEYTRISVLLRIFVTLFVESVVCVILGYGGYLVYTPEELARKDDINKPFVNDERVVGRWISHSFLGYQWDKADFSTEREPIEDLYFKELEFFPDGNARVVYEDAVFEGDDTVVWTKNYLLRKWNWFKEGDLKLDL